MEEQEREREQEEEQRALIKGDRGQVEGPKQRFGKSQPDSRKVGEMEK